ncbi:hypothetical protein TNCV_1637871 [Trichonephila clavipes]|nr:hypothetical protein TNCV_1637871 [Trichonephila clavipes]
MDRWATMWVRSASSLRRFLLHPQDNARPHVANTVRDFCSAQLKKLLPCPDYWMDVSSIEYVWVWLDMDFFWVHKKSLVYKTSVSSFEGITPISVAAERIRGIPGMLQNERTEFHAVPLSGMPGDFL